MPSDESNSEAKSDGVNLSGHVGSLGGDVVGGNKITIQNYGPNKDEIVEALVKALEARGRVQAAATAGLDRRAIVELAKGLKPAEAPTLEHATQELEGVVAVAVDVIAKGERAANSDKFVNDVLARFGDTERLKELERLLAIHVGPIAGLLVRRTATEAERAGDLVQLLAQHIPQPDERENFIAAGMRIVQRCKFQDIAQAAPDRAGPDRAAPDRAAPPAGSEEHSQPDTALTEDEIERARVALAARIGPIATVLVRRAARSSESAAEFWEELSHHIVAASDRADFLRQQHARTNPAG